MGNWYAFFIPFRENLQTSNHIRGQNIFTMWFFAPQPFYTHCWQITLEASPPSLQGLQLASISKPYLPLHGLHIFGANTTIFTAWLYRIIFPCTNLVGQILFHKLAIIRSSIKILIHRMRKLRAIPPWGFYVAFWKVFPLCFPQSICNEKELREY